MPSTAETSRRAAQPPNSGWVGSATLTFRRRKKERGRILKHAMRNSADRADLLAYCA